MAEKNLEAKLHTPSSVGEQRSVLRIADALAEHVGQERGGAVGVALSESFRLILTARAAGHRGGGEAENAGRGAQRLAVVGRHLGAWQIGDIILCLAFQS